TAYELSQALSKIESAIESIQGTPTVMIGGDFNLPTTEWTEGQPQSNGQMTTTIESFQARLLLTQVVNKATHRSGNTLDVVFTNYRQMFNEINCIPTTFSDHFVVEIASHFKSHFAKAQQRSKQFFNKFDEHNFFSEDVQWDNIRQELSTQLFWQNFDQCDTAASKLDFLITKCEEAGAAHAPKKKTNNSKKKLIPRDRRILMRRRRKIAKQLANSPAPSKKCKLENELIEIEDKLQASFKKSNDFQETKAIEAIKRNPKFFFSYVKKFSKIKTAIGPLLNQDGEYVSDNKEMADATLQSSAHLSQIQLIQMNCSQTTMRHPNYQTFNLLQKMY
ncbi:MAG: hypothetical protein VYA01_00720, partial [Bacteroidota bacterium]|nr:hypothetical protein [Bacteroidota bacterium]